MVILSKAGLDDLSLIQTCKPATTLFTGIPVIDLTDPHANTLIVQACQDFGFFKVVNHGVPMDLVTKLEAEALNFFNLPQSDKDKVGPPNPFGYGNKRIGLNGDMGWIEYLLFTTNPQLISHKSLSIFPKNSEFFWGLVNEYVSGVRNMACELLELIADGLKIGPRNVLSRLLKDEMSDSVFRLNHYPPLCPHPNELQALRGGSLIGFGEHTDPQVISVLRSNNTSGLQICLKDGTWASVPPDPSSFFINVDDSLQVLTNGRFKSVKHRVLADNLKTSRVSMVYFGGPPLSEKITPLPSLMDEKEESLYKEFTWCEYKKSAYKTRLADNRLQMFEKFAGQ